MIRVVQSLSNVFSRAMRLPALPSHPRKPVGVPRNAFRDHVIVSQSRPTTPLGATLCDFDGAHRAHQVFTSANREQHLEVLLPVPVIKMSGIDIAGLILGSIPLIITGLEHYAEGVSTIKVMLNASSEFRTLSRRLRVEYDIFRNITELMLNGCVDDQELTELLENVGGRCWSNPAVELSLQKKLQRSYKVYVETVQEMDRTLKEFRKRLRLGDDGRVCTPFAAYRALAC